MQTATPKLQGTCEMASGVSTGGDPGAEPQERDPQSTSPQLETSAPQETAGRVWDAHVTKDLHPEYTQLPPRKIRKWQPDDKRAGLHRCFPTKTKATSRELGTWWAALGAGTGTLESTLAAP